MANLALLWKNDLNHHTYTYDGFNCNGANPNPGGTILPQNSQMFTGQDSGFMSVGAYMFNAGKFWINVCFHQSLAGNNWVECPYGRKDIGLDIGSRTLDGGFVLIAVDRNANGMTLSVKDNT